MATIAENLTRIQSAKTDIKDAIEAKGVTVPSSVTIDTYASYVSQISGGGGSSADTAALKGIIDRSLTSIDIPSGTTTIGAYAFYNCTGLTSMIIPDSVTTIDYYAFNLCYSLTNVTIPSGVTSIGENAFGTCINLGSIDIPNSVTSIGGYAFNGCISLTGITIGSGVTSIGTQAFGYCTSLSSITIPSGVTTIGGSAFDGSSGLSAVTIEATTPPTLGLFAFDNTNNCPIYVPSGSVSTYQAASGWSTYADRIQAIPAPAPSQTWVVYHSGDTIPTGVTFEGVRVYSGTSIDDGGCDLYLTESDCILSFGHDYICTESNCTEYECAQTECMEYDPDTGDCLWEDCTEWGPDCLNWECVSYANGYNVYSNQTGENVEQNQFTYDINGYWSYEAEMQSNMSSNPIPFDIELLTNN